MARVDRRGFLRVGGHTYIIPNMFARVVTNAAKPKEAILGAETEIKRLFDKK